jgi:hypothetical protein
MRAGRLNLNAEDTDEAITYTNFNRLSLADMDDRLLTVSQ